MRTLVSLLLLLPALTGAGEILESSVTLADGVYTIRVEARIQAPPETVFRFITDYEHLPDINPSIRESRVLYTYSPSRHRVRTVIQACLLFFCRSVLQVQDIEQHGTTQLTAYIIPDLSDFSYGKAEWMLHENGEATLMHFSAELAPGFWMPPLIGPWLVRNKVVSELLESAACMEMDVMESAAP